MSEPRGRLKPVSDPTHQGASLSKPRSYQGRRPTFRMRDNRGNIPIFKAMASALQQVRETALGAYPNCISGGTSGFMSDAPPSA